jgi:Fe-S cluster assembly protein SufD
MTVTAPEAGLETPFDILRELQTDDVPGSVGSLRARGFERLCEIGLPTTKDEDWKYTSLAPLKKDRYRLPLGYDVPREAFAPFLICEVSSAEIVFVNGRYSEPLSNCNKLPPSVVLRPLREALADHPDEDLVGRTGSIDAEMHPFAALNMALLGDGIHLRVSAGAVIPKPVHLMFVSTGGDHERVVSAPRIVIEAEEGSQFSVLETFLTAGSSNVMSNPLTEIIAGQGSIVDHYRVQQEGREARHFGLIRATAARDSVVRSHLITLGASVSRSDVSVLLDGEGADCTMNGLYLLEGEQHADHQTLIDHAKPHCTSRELYKGILDDRSRGIFEGRIIVRPDAQKTNSSQTNNNLILSREAIANTTPQLEIYADDVKCAHGSTIGRLDENAIFYLRARGVSLEDARDLLTLGFASQVLAGIRIEPVEKRLEALLMSRLAKDLDR